MLRLETVSLVFRWQGPGKRGGSVLGSVSRRTSIPGEKVCLCTARILTHTMNVDGEQGQSPLEHFMCCTGKGTLVGRAHEVTHRARGRAMIDCTEAYMASNSLKLEFLLLEKKIKISGYPNAFCKGPITETGVNRQSRRGTHTLCGGVVLECVF